MDLWDSIENSQKNQMTNKTEWAGEMERWIYKVDSQASDMDDWMDNRAWGTQRRSRSTDTRNS